MPRVLWTSRKFNFDFPHELYPEMLERLYGTPLRLENLLKSINSSQLTQKQGERWSIQENAGHFIQVEPLWISRIDDILSGDEVMRAADMSNKRTYEADYNEMKIGDIVGEFHDVRRKFTDRLRELSEDDFARSAIHPRLNKPMRIIDLCYFAAEHDDFHLATIRELDHYFGY